ALAGGADTAEAERAAAAAADRASRGFLSAALGLASQFGLTSFPSLDDPGFVAAVVFDPEQPAGTPKARLSYLFPDAGAAQIIVRLRPDLSEDERGRAVELIRAAVEEERPRQRCAAPPAAGGEPQPCFALSSGEYVVSGGPVVVDALADVLRRALLVLLAAAFVLMGLALTVVFRSRAVLLPLGLALGAAAIAFGALGLVGGRLSIAAIAVLPILIGLAVDYAIQLQARFDEAIAAARTATAPVAPGDPPAVPSPDLVAEAARDAARLGGPIVGTACLATTAGFAILALSPTPMVRGFGLLLAGGVLIAFTLALVVGSAALALRERRAPRRWASAAPLRQARERVAGRLGSFGTAALEVAARAPGRVLVIAALLAALGWAAGTRAETVSEIPELVPQSLAEVRDLQTLQEATGVSGEVDVLVTAPDLTDPELIAWMAAYKRRVLAAAGYDASEPDCRAAELCPGPSLTDFIADAESGVTRDRIRGVIDALPAQELRGVIEIDPETGELGEAALLAFMIRLMPLERQQELIEMMRDQIESGGRAGADRTGPGGRADGPPDGVTVQVGGLPVIAAETADDLAGSRYWLALASLAAVALVLLLLFRSPIRVLVPLVPITLATGWSSLMLAAMEVPLNPISAVLGVMVVAIGTEFSVILSSRYRQERLGGAPPAQALRRTYARSGAAVLASGVTVITGFAALIFSEVRMLRDFGLVTVVDLGVALAGVMLILPAVLVIAERWAAVRDES
ncbi:MAG TPA: MMPL family transporter, partial [Solirubrobacterales bacterium]|nr:MMPL family transporter [Solirubrobacterales bacterium]